MKQFLQYQLEREQRETNRGAKAYYDDLISRNCNLWLLHRLWKFFRYPTLSSVLPRQPMLLAKFQTLNHLNINININCRRGEKEKEREQCIPKSAASKSPRISVSFGSIRLKR